MHLLALTLALAAPQTAPDPAVVNAAPVTESQPAPVQVVNDPPRARALCEALTPADRLRGGGDVVAQARAEAQQESRREAALNGRYQVTVPGAALRFAPYDREEQVLSLSDRTFLAGAGGTLHLWTVSRSGLPVTADEATAARIAQAAARKKLALVFTFTLPDDEDEALCAHAAGSLHYALGVEPFAWEYAVDGQVLARGGEGGDRPLLTAAQGARPRVEVSDPYGAGGRAARQALEASATALQGCYAQALARSPGLDGTLVAEVDPGASPRVRMAADSVQDEGLSACVQGVVSRVRFPGGARLDLPIHFLLEPPTAAR
ncbi:MAG TPA: hypothetical protein VF805_01690 [Anaeromyxobacteraceae bacterium]